MARPAEFDREQALTDAMLVFWRQGYHKTSVRDLTKATKLQPGSLYGAFSNKRTLFLQSLDHYSSMLEKIITQVLYSDQKPLVRIEQFFSRVLLDPEMKGCLLVNTLLETPVEDEEIFQHASQALRKVEQAFKENLKEAITRNDIPADRDPEIMSQLLMTGIYGLRVYNKLKPGKKALKKITDGMLAILH